MALSLMRYDIRFVRRSLAGVRTRLLLVLGCCLKTLPTVESGTVDLKQMGPNLVGFDVEVFAQ